MTHSFPTRRSCDLSIVDLTTIEDDSTREEPLHPSSAGPRKPPQCYELLHAITTCPQNALSTVVGHSMNTAGLVFRAGLHFHRVHAPDLSGACVIAACCGCCSRKEIGRVHF